MILTSAAANKMIKRLEDDKIFLLKKEQGAYIYRATADEVPVIPEYDFVECEKQLEEINNKVVAIKHAVNIVNSTNAVRVGDKEMTIDALLVRMAQLNHRKSFLNELRVLEPKTRINESYRTIKNSTPEYQYINYDLAVVKEEYNRIDTEIVSMQMALDKFNQTFEFEVNI